MSPANIYFKISVTNCINHCPTPLFPLFLATVIKFAFYRAPPFGPLMPQCNMTHRAIFSSLASLVPKNISTIYLNHTCLATIYFLQSCFRIILFKHIFINVLPLKLNIDDTKLAWYQKILVSSSLLKKDDIFTIYNQFLI